MFTPFPRWLSGQLFSLWRARCPVSAVRDRTCQPSFEPLEDRTLLASGILDPAFGTGGTVISPFLGSLDNPAHAAALQPDGKVVVAGSVGTTNNTDVALARYNA